jgi:DNA-binding NtrC family response regulator
MNHAPTILVIDDLSGSQSMLCQILLDAGYSVRALPTREATLRVLPDARPAIVLMEWSADGVGADRFIQYIRQHSDTDVVIMTTEDRFAKAAEACGVVYILRKPFQVEQLLNTIDSCVCRRLLQAI